MKTPKTLVVITLVTVALISGSQLLEGADKPTTLAKSENSQMEMELNKYGKCLDFPLCRERI